VNDHAILAALSVEDQVDDAVARQLSTRSATHAHHHCCRVLALISSVAAPRLVRDRPVGGHNSVGQLASIAMLHPLRVISGGPAVPERAPDEAQALIPVCLGPAFWDLALWSCACFGDHFTGESWVRPWSASLAIAVLPAAPAFSGAATRSYGESSNPYCRRAAPAMPIDLLLHPTTQLADHLATHCRSVSGEVASRIAGQPMQGSGKTELGHQATVGGS